MILSAWWQASKRVFKHRYGKVIPGLVGSIGVGLAITLLIIYGGFVNSSSQSVSVPVHSIQSYQTTTRHASAALGSIEDFGPVLTLDQARQQIGLNFTLPTVLPAGLILQEIRGEIKGEVNTFNQVVLIYSSPVLPKLSYNHDVSMIISLSRDGSIYYPHPPSNPIILKATTVSGHPGWGYDPQPNSGNMGGLTWWSNGVHCTMVSFLPLSAVVEIAQSMNT